MADEKFTNQQEELLDEQLDQVAGGSLRDPGEETVGPKGTPLDSADLK